MKLCIGRVSCVIENRLESEDDELERRLVRKRRSSTSVDTSTRSLSILRRPSATGPNQPTQRASLGSLPASSAGPGVSDPPDNLPLSHTWHAGSERTTAGPLMSDQDDSGRGLQRYRGYGSRANLLKHSRLWGSNRGSRIDEEAPTTPTHAVAGAAAAAAAAEAGTPTKAVKFSLGRRRTEGNAFTGGGLRHAGASGEATAAGVSPASATALKLTGGALGGTGGRKLAAGKEEAGEETNDSRAAVMNVTVQTRLWAEYFNSTLRCWEALLDPFR